MDNHHCPGLNLKIFDLSLRRGETGVPGWKRLSGSDIHGETLLAVSTFYLCPFHSLVLHWLPMSHYCIILITFCISSISSTALSFLPCLFVCLSGISNTWPNLHFFNIYRHKSPLLSHAQYTWSSSFFIYFCSSMSCSPCQPVSVVIWSRCMVRQTIQRNSLKENKRSCLMR